MSRVGKVRIRLPNEFWNLTHLWALKSLVHTCLRVSLFKEAYLLISLSLLPSFRSGTNSPKTLRPKKWYRVDTSTSRIWAGLHWERFLLLLMASSEVNQSSGPESQRTLHSRVWCLGGDGYEVGFSTGTPTRGLPHAGHGEADWLPSEQISQDSQAEAASPWASEGAQRKCYHVLLVTRASEGQPGF